MAFSASCRFFNSSWILFILLYCPLLQLIKGISGLQRFDKQPSYSEVNPGDDIKLDCKIFNKRGTCSWQKDNKPVGIYIKKYEWSGSQEAGDCSLWIRAATLEFDDGEWECQVTASDFTTQDALTSTPVRLVVRVAPQRPRIEHKSVQVLPANNVTARAGDKTTVKCISRYGNPPAKLKWFLGETELLGGNQSNSPEMDNPRTWVATSIIDVNVDKVQHGKTLRCVAIHESYPTKAQSLDVRLDVTYPPEVRMIGEPTTDLEENRDSVDIRCVTDANPQAGVVWRKAGRADITSVEESLQFRPITRRDSGMYTCQAKNILGTSEPLSVSLDVKFGPIIKSVGPNRETTTTLYSEMSFDCEAEASPTPSYQWLQRVQGMDNAVLVRSNDARLHIRNVSYHHQGDYICRVWNYIGGSERSVQSDPVSLKVKGPPQIIRGTGLTEVIAHRGTEALLSLVVCSDPGPAKVSWEWGSLRLQKGESMGRFKADELNQQESREICYEARLHIFDVDATDSRNYFLTVENERGSDRHYLRLAVRGSYTNEPLAMMTLVSLAGGCLTFFFVCVLCGVYCARTEKCCFSRRSDFQPTDLESEKSDISSMMSRKGGGPIVSGIGGVGGPRPDLGGGGGGMGGPLRTSAEHIYRSGGGPHSISAPSPDAMKKKKKRRQRKDGNGKSCSDESVRMCHDDVPTVSNHHGGGGVIGGGGVGVYPTPHQRLAYYTKSFPSPATTAADYGPSPYFCPAPQQNRTFAYDNARTMRASSYYQPNSIDKAEI